MNMTSQLESFLFSFTPDFLKNLYHKYLQNPSSIAEDWRKIFDEEKEAIEEFFTDYNIKTEVTDIIASIEKEEYQKALSKNKKQVTKRDNTLQNLENMKNAYRNFGYRIAQLDPLELMKPNFAQFPELSYEYHNIDINSEEGANALKEIENIRSFYSNKIGYELHHLTSLEEQDWFRNKIENSSFILSNEDKKRICQDLIEVDGFEKFLHGRFPGMKRFSLEGGDTTITAVEEIIYSASKANCSEIVFGMAHRGRLNMLTKVTKKSYTAMLSEFVGNMANPKDTNIPGDVKYHLGASCDRKIANSSIHLTMVPNPSHLEAVNTVVLGKVRAQQKMIKDDSSSKVIPILLHGNAAFAGQGIVYETFLLYRLPAYKVGGTIHIVTNNQVGFTACAHEETSANSCADIGKAFDVPIIHVNGDDVESVVKVAQIAFEYRQTFKKDIIIDICCYRLHGHNESDEPNYTQPIMYRKISSHKAPAELYSKQLEKENILSANEFSQRKEEFKGIMSKAFDEAKTYEPKKAEWLQGSIWSHFVDPRTKEARNGNTNISKELANQILDRIYFIPNNFEMNSKLQKQTLNKKKIFEEGGKFDWATGEALAFGSLLSEGYGVRLTGQDVIRGTFSHRHSGFTDQTNETKYFPLAELAKNNNIQLEIANSPLSEYGVMGFEYGHAIENPNILTLWEAQFGDFGNGAQIMIDQFIASAQEKWLRQSGLVLLLPHGMEGQGPEHSSARLERFLQLCANDNMSVLNCTTPASYFHALRMQIHRNYRKPLIIVTPKSLLRNKLAMSSLEDVTNTQYFQPILEEKTEYTNAKTIIFCSGKIYYDLSEARDNLKKDIAIIRLEQLYPFSDVDISQILKKYSKHENIYWCQEEHRNAGAWSFIFEKFAAKLNLSISYLGRAESSSPACGYGSIHKAELEKILDELKNLS